jgi:hypothetical protein
LRAKRGRVPDAVQRLWTMHRTAGTHRRCGPNHGPPDQQRNVRAAQHPGHVNTPSPSRGALHPSCCLNPSPNRGRERYPKREAARPQERARGMPGARCTRSRACRIGSTRVSHHEFTGTPGIPARDGFNGFLRTLPGDRALLSLSPRRYRRVRPIRADIASATLDANH